MGMCNRNIYLVFMVVSKKEPFLGLNKWKFSHHFNLFHDYALGIAAASTAAER